MIRTSPLLLALAACALLAAPARAQRNPRPRPAPATADTLARDTIPLVPDTVPRDTIVWRRDTVWVATDSAAMPAPVGDSARRVPPPGRRDAAADSARRAPRRRNRTAAAPRRKPAEGLRMCAGGDVTLGTNLDTTWVQTARMRLGRPVAALPDPDSLLAPLRPLVADADVLMLNVESAIGSGPPARRKCAPGSNVCFAFRSPPAAAGAIRRIGGSAQVVGNVANNHARDAGDAGWRTTQRLLTEAGVGVIGADTLPTLVRTADGDTVAFLGFSPWTGPDPRNLAAVRRHVRRAAARWRYVAVSVHIGAEGAGAQHTRDATETFVGEDRGNPVAFAHAAIDAGADVVFGHGPHVVRAMEWYRDGLIFYSLGNLVTYGPFSLGEPLNRGAIGCVDLDEQGRVTQAELRSTRQMMPGLVQPDTTNTAAALVGALSRQDFPATGVRVAETGAILPGGGEVTVGGSATTPRRRP